MAQLKHLEAVVFDMDGVLAETEAAGHRVAFNETFKRRGIGAEWGIELYGELLKISGGKERMRHFFQENPGLVDLSDELIAALHKEKTAIFQELIQSHAVPPRPGARELLEELKASGIPFALATTSNEKSANTLATSLFGEEIHKAFTAILAGDIVKKKKPDPEIYTLTTQKLGINPARAVVLEDTRNGLLSAKAAGYLVCVTISQYSQDEDFAEADMVVSSLGSAKEPCDLIEAPCPLTTPGQVRLADFDRLVECRAS